MKDRRHDGRKAIAAMLGQGVLTGVFPQAELLVARAGRVVLHQRVGFDRGGRKRFFDLASLTKPLCTALLCLREVQDGRLDLDTPVGDLIRADGLHGVTVRSLLRHTSGFKAWHDFSSSGFKRRAIFTALRQNRRLRGRPGVTTYSDLGYILLGEILERLIGRPLHEQFCHRITAPLGLTHSLFFVPGGRTKIPRERFVPAEVCHLRGREIQGSVMDENAWALGGVAGHAGLFGDAAAVHRVLTELRRASLGRSRLIRKEFFDLFCRPDLLRSWNARVFTLGFDTPTRPGSQSGRFFSKASIGHLGFSGTSFWWDLKRDVWIILLTNRCMPLRQNKKLSVFRPRLHDAVMTRFLLKDQK
jgi:CubicO group peptidase (beta-lactamase class C family)